MGKKREIFEAWYSKHCEPGIGHWFVRDKHNSDEYYMSHTQTAWDAWQAAIAAQWLPIETAPKNGDVIILYNAGDVAAGWWHPHIHNGVAYDWCFIEDVDVDEDQRIVPNAWLKKHPPTHWMPLPPEPTK